jgi:hypothetical protein
VTKDAANRLRRYTLTPGQFLDMLLAQDHRCAICRVSFRELRKAFLCVDHDHAFSLLRVNPILEPMPLYLVDNTVEAKGYKAVLIAVISFGNSSSPIFSEAVLMIVSDRNGS